MLFKFIIFTYVIFILSFSCTYIELDSNTSNDRTKQEQTSIISPMKKVNKNPYNYPKLISIFKNNLYIALYDKNYVENTIVVDIYNNISTIELLYGNTSFLIDPLYNYLIKPISSAIVFNDELIFRGSKFEILSYDAETELKKKVDFDDSAYGKPDYFTLINNKIFYFGSNIDCQIKDY